MPSPLRSDWYVDPTGSASPNLAEPAQIGYDGPSRAKAVNDSPLRGWASQAWERMKGALPDSNVVDAAPKGGLVSRAGSAVLNGLGKVAGGAGALTGAYEMGQGIGEGDFGKAAFGAGDAAAGAALYSGVGTLPAAAYLGARGAYQLGDALPQAGKDRIGEIVNRGLRTVGLGVNDDALQMDKAAVNTGLPSPVTGVTGSPVAARSAASGAAGANYDSRMVRDAGLRGDPTAVTRQGNSFSNTGEYQGGPGVTQLAGDPDVARDRTLRAAAIYKSMNDAQKVNPNEQMSVVPDSIGAETRARNGSIRSAFEPTGVLQTQARAQEETARANRAREGIEVRGQDVNADTARAGHGVTLRGQDLTYDSTTRGQDMTARTAANSARLQQMNTDRQYNLDVTKFGADQAKTNFETRQKAAKDMHESIAGMLPTGPDNKPDTATAARYMTGLNGALDGFQRVLEQRAAGGDAAAAKQLEDVRQRGVAALDQKDVRTFIKGMQAKDLSDQYASGPLNPVGGTGVIDDRPATGLRKTSDGFLGFGGEYSLVGPDGKLTGATIPSRAVEGDGGIFPGGKKRVDMRELIR